MKSKIWIAGFLAGSVILLFILGYNVYVTDPFFHYHKPLTDKFFYFLDNERMQNDGIVRHFDYDAIITGTSVSEYFKTSEMDELFGTSSIKVPYQGASWKEVNDNLLKAVNANKNIRMVIRNIDEIQFLNEKDDLNEEYDYPEYLYNDDPLDDVNYLLNRDVLFNRVFPMYTYTRMKNFTPGHTTFDIYPMGNWSEAYGKDVVLENYSFQDIRKEEVPFPDEDRIRLIEDVRQNLTDVADENPQITFFYFFSPYSAVFWRNLAVEGYISRLIEEEKTVIEEILKHENIKLFSFHDRTDITADLNNYTDPVHYAPWVNSWILSSIYAERGLLTEENYGQYLSDLRDFYHSYDFEALKTQKDYEDDSEAFIRLIPEIYGDEPFQSISVAVDSAMIQSGIIQAAETVKEQHEGTDGIISYGRLKRQFESQISTDEYILWTDDYCGVKLTIDEAAPYRYLSFYGKKLQDNGQPGVYVYDESGNVVSSYVHYSNLTDDQWHRYLLDLRYIRGKVTIVFNGGYVDITGSPDSSFIFSNINLY